MFSYEKEGINAMEENFSSRCVKILPMCVSKELDEPWKESSMPSILEEIYP